MKSSTRLASLLTLAVASAMSIGAQAATISLTPKYDNTVALQPQTLQFNLSMNFADSEATLGGGIDLALGNFLSGLTFTPSTYFLNTADAAFSGWGTTFADHDLEVHIGSFNGLSGQHDLGTITTTLTRAVQPGGPTTSIAMSINSHYGDFYSALPPFGQMTVQLIGVTIPVPEPDAALLLLAGLPMLIPFCRRSRAKRAA